MAKVKKVWTHKKYSKKRKFIGSYSYHRGGRVFEISDCKRTITFESPQAAKLAGWKQK